MSGVHSHRKAVLANLHQRHPERQPLTAFDGTLRLRPEAATLRTRSALAVPPGFDGLLRPTSRRFFAPCNRPWGSPRFKAGIVHWTHHSRFQERSGSDGPSLGTTVVACRSGRTRPRTTLPRPSNKPLRHSRDAIPFEAFPRRQRLHVTPAPGAPTASRKKCGLLRPFSPHPSSPPKPDFTTSPALTPFGSHVRATLFARLHLAVDSRSRRIAPSRTRASGLCSIGEFAVPTKRFRLAGTRCFLGLIASTGLFAKGCLPIGCIAAPKRLNAPSGCAAVDPHRTDGRGPTWVIVTTGGRIAPTARPPRPIPSSVATLPAHGFPRSLLTRLGEARAFACTHLRLETPSNFRSRRPSLPRQRHFVRNLAARRRFRAGVTLLDSRRVRRRSDDRPGFTEHSLARAADELQRSDRNRGSNPRSVGSRQVGLPTSESPVAGQASRSAA